MIYYITTYPTFTLLALGLLFVYRNRLMLMRREYWRWLLKNWKIVTFILAAVILSSIALISGYPTWDIPETIVICGLTFLTAPWAVGVVYRVIVGYERAWREVYIAIILWLFASSWSY
jgi:hypothetical protein